MIPTGPYTITLALGVLLGALLAFTGLDRRLRWPAGAMILSLIAARAATAFPDDAMPILLVMTPACAWLALVNHKILRRETHYPYLFSINSLGISRAASVIAILYVPRLLCYAANAFGLLDRAMMWEFSNAFLVLQIAALFAGVIGGGHAIFSRLSLGADAFGRRPLRLHRTEAAGHRFKRNPKRNL